MWFLRRYLKILMFVRVETLILKMFVQSTIFTLGIICVENDSELSTIPYIMCASDYNW